jgi:hypothetical protein
MQEPVIYAKEEPHWRNRIAIIIISLSLGFATFPNMAMMYFFKDTLHLNIA